MPDNVIMKMISRKSAVAPVLLAAVLILLTACSNKRDLNDTQPYILVTPTIAGGIDLGQSVALTARVIDDSSNAGVTWSYSGLGALTNQTTTSATYTAPAYSATAVNGSGILTVTSIAYPAYSVTFTFPINPPPLVGTTAANITGTVKLTCAPQITITNPAIYIGNVYQPLVNLSTAVTIATSPTTSVSDTTGVSPYYWTLASGTLPPGIFVGTLGTSTTTTIGNNQLSGIPTTPGTYTFALNVTDSALPPITTTSPNYTIAVSQAPALALYTGPILPNSTITAGSPTVTVPSSIATSCSTAPLSTLANVALVTGANVSGPGIPAGTTITAVSTANNITSLTLSANATATGTGTVTVSNPNATTLPTATSGAPYAQPIETLGGGGLINWTVAAGSSLPAGLSLLSTQVTNTSAGVNAIATASLTGTPSVPGVYSFTLAATDSASGSYAQSITQQFSLTVAAAPKLVISSATLPSPRQNVPYASPLTATGGVPAITWSVTSGSLPAGLTLSAAGILSGTSSVLGTSNFTITAKDSGIPVQTAQQTYALTVVPGPLSVATPSLSSGAQGSPYNQQLRISGGLAPVTWALNSGTLPPGITLNGTTGVLSGTPTATGNYSVSLQATDSTSPTAQTAAKVFTITINPAPTGVNDAELSGNYAFLLKGFDATGQPLALIGAFTADGKGNITAGTEDINGLGLTAPVSNQPVTGTYLVGSDNRGTITLTSASGNSTFAIALSKVSGSVSGGGRIVSFNAGGPRLSGSFYLRTAAAFSNTALKGGYTFGLSGVSGASTNAAIIGELQLDGSGNLTGLEDSNFAGTAAASVAIAPGSSYNIASTGRGTETITTSSGSSTYVAYVVSASRILVAASGAASASSGLLSGQQLQQTAPAFGNATLSGPAILWQQKLNASAADVQLGRIGFDGAGNINLYATDEDAGGTDTSNTLPATAPTYSVASTGRAVVTGGGAVLPVTMYLVGENQGFSLDSSAAVNFGAFEPQTVQTYSAVSFIGNFALGTANPLLSTMSLSSGTFTADGVSALSGAQDISTAGVLAGDQTFAGSFVAAASGRVVLTSPYAVAGTPGVVFYLVSSNRAFGLDLGSGTPEIFELDHQ